MKTKKSPESSISVCSLTEAVFGYTSNGAVRFYLAEEGEQWRKHPDRFVQGHSARCTRFSSKRRPVLALVREGEGLWFDDVEEWLELEAKPNAWVAFSVSEARALIEHASVGDKLVALGTTTLATLLGGEA